MKLDRATIHVKWKLFLFVIYFVVYLQSALALISVNVSTVKENLEIEYRRLAQVKEKRFFA